MPYFLAPDPIQGTFLVPGTNTPASGALIFTYLTGTTTKVTVYQDDAGAASHTNPIVLDSGGNLPSASAVWLLGGQAYRFVWAPANDTDPPASSYRTMDDVSGVNDVSVAASLQWVAGPAPTFVGATALTVSGDQTGNAQVGRRIETENTGGTIYSTITSSVFSASTTAIGVNNDSGSLDAGLSSLNYGLLTRVNPSIPILTDFYPLRSSSSDATKNFRVEVGPAGSSTTIIETIPQYSFRPATQNRGAQVSSQSTTNVSTATGDLIEITNTNAINQFTMFNGQLATLRFTTTTPLNYSANLPVPGETNITTAAGEMMVLRGTSTDAVLIQNYQVPSLNPQNTIESGLVHITTLTANVTSTVDFLTGITSTYRQYEMRFVGLVPVTDAVAFQLRMSNDGGATFFGGGSDYRYANLGIMDTGATSDTVSVGASVIRLNAAANQANNVSNTFNGVMTLDRLSENVNKSVRFEFSYFSTSAYVNVRGAGWSNAAALNTSAVNALRIIPSSGNVSSGVISLFGIRVTP